MEYRPVSYVGKIWFGVNKTLLLLIFILFSVGILTQAIISAKLPEVALGKYLFFGLVGVALMFVIVFSNKKTVYRGIVYGFIISLFMMILVPFIGVENGGAVRWLRIPILNLTFQPMEFYKVFSVACFALIQGWMCEFNISKLWRALVAVLFFVLTFILAIVQPDHGQMVLCFMALGFIILLSLEVRFIATMCVVAISGLVILYLLLNFSSHGSERIMNFLNENYEKYSQLWYVKEAISDFALFGQSPGRLFWPVTPDVESDFVFAMLIENFGIVITFSILLLFMVLMFGFCKLIWFTNNIRWWFMVCGLVVLYVGQALLNFGTGSLSVPAKGVTFPLISYGGSAQISVLLMLGLLLFITRKDIRED